jgi:formylglycine-generating enzyme required for sulfatase activity
VLVPPTDRHSLLGTTIAEKYVIESVVGAGGFATVYRARHLIWQRPVAIKLFTALGATTSAEQQFLVDAFLREGALLAELSELSPAICQARDAGTVVTAGGSTLPYLVLEWLDGASLADILAVEVARERAPRPIHEAVRLLEPIARALAIAHERGIVHRDVKPGNIFVLGDPSEDDCSVKLLDFGVAKVLSGGSTGALKVTVGNLTAFTPQYGAPEQFSRSHGPTGPGTDVYALALVLVELVAGREPQEGADVAAVAAVAMNAKRRPTPRTFGVRISDEIESIFQRALAVDSKARFASAADFWGEIHSALELDGFDAQAGVRSAHLGKVGPVLEAAPTRDAPPSSVMRLALLDADRSAAKRRRWLAPSIALASLVSLASAGLLSRVFGREATIRSPQSPVASPSVMPSPPPVVLAADTTCPVGMRTIPRGEFFMGDDEGTPFERPAHHARLRAYCVDTFEVTVAAYQACSDVGECKRAGSSNSWEDISDRQHATFDPLCNERDPTKRAQHPINCVDWDMASHFCKTRGKRLPTEAEWEFAARGPDGRRYPWGDTPPGPTLLNACGRECLAWGRAHGEDEHAMYAGDDGWQTTAPVGSFPKGASPYGLEDVVGNVWEWVDDWFAPYDAGESERDGPTGPPAGTEKVIRGGAWNGAEPSWVRPTFRYKDAPTKRSYGIGFRCAKSVERGT